MAEVQYLFQEKQSQATEYLKLLLSVKEKELKIKTQEKIIKSQTDLIYTIETMSRTIPSGLFGARVLAEKEISDLNNAIKTIKENIEKVKPKLITMYDEAYESFCQNKVNTYEFDASVNIVSKVKEFREAADIDYNNRNPNSISAKKLSQSSNRLRAKSYIQQSIKKFNDLKATIAQQKIDTATSPILIDKLMDQKDRAIRESEHAELKSNESKIINDQRQQNDKPIVEIEDPINKSNLKKLTKLVINQPDIEKVGEIKNLPDTNTPNPYSSAEFTEESPNIIAEYNPVRYDAKEIIIKPENMATQLISGDYIDPREVELIAPVSYLAPIPSYIRVMNENGFSGNFSNESTQLTESSDGNTKSTALTYSKLPTMEQILNADGSFIYNQFTLTGIEKNFPQKVQIEETFSDAISVFAFGNKVKIWRVTGTLVNDIVSNWKSKFEEAFDSYLKIDKLIKNKKYVKLVIPADRSQIDCYPLDLNISVNITSEGLVPFVMPVLVRRYKPLTQIQASKNFMQMVSTFKTLYDPKGKSATINGETTTIAPATKRN